MTSKAFYSFMGLAVGDAVGTTQEFTEYYNDQNPFFKEPQTDMIGGGPFHLEEGNWTDDTSMALCMAWSIIEKKQIDLEDHLIKYIQWRDKAWFSSNKDLADIGTTVSSSLSNYQENNDKVIRDFNPFSAGNGCLMKLAPVPVLFHKHPELAIRYSAYSCINTHNATSAIDCCRYLAALIVGAIQGASKEQLTTPFFVPAGLPPNYWSLNPLCDQVNDMILNYNSKQLKPREKSLSEKDKKTTDYIFNSGYSVKSLEAVLWHLKNSNSFKEGVLNITNQGLDSDTIAAIYGQVAGPLYSDSFPTDWMNKLTFSPFLQFVSSTLCLLADHVTLLHPIIRVQESERTETCLQERPFDINNLISFQISGIHVLLNQVLNDRVTGYNLLNASQFDTFKNNTNFKSDMLLNYLFQTMSKQPLAISNTYNSQLIEYDQFEDFVNSLFFALLSKPYELEITNSVKLKNISYFFRIQALPVLLLLDKPFSPELNSTIMKLLEIVEKIRNSTDCYDYFFYVLKTELQPFVNFSWMQLRNEYTNPEKNFDKELASVISQSMHQTFSSFFNFEDWNYDYFNPYTATLLMFDDSKEFVKPLLKAMQPELMLHDCLQLFKTKGVFFSNSLGQLLYADKNFYEDNVFCQQLTCKNIDLIFNFAKILPLNEFRNQKVFMPGYWKLYAHDDLEKFWFLCHWHLQSMHLKKMKLFNIICDKQANEKRTSDFQETKLENREEPTKLVETSKGVSGSNRMRNKSSTLGFSEEKETMVPTYSFQREESKLTEEQIKTRNDIFQNGSESMVEFLYSNLPEENGFEFENNNTGNKVLVITIFEQELNEIQRITLDEIKRIPLYQETLQFFKIELQDAEIYSVFINNLPTDNTQYDLIVVNTGRELNPNVPTKYFESLNKLLVETGKLVVISALEELQKASSKASQYIQSLKESNLFCFFKTGYYFYMKKMEEGNKEYCYYASSFATIPIPFKNNTTKPVISLPPNTQKVCYAILTSNDKLECKEVVCENKTTETVVLSLNYYESIQDCDSVLSRLNGGWGSLKEETGEKYAKLKEKTFNYLDTYFITTAVKGGGNCLFIAMNELLITRNFERLNLRNLFDGVVKFRNLPNFQNIQTFFSFQEEGLLNEITDFDKSAFIDYYLGGNNKSDVWLFVIAFMYKIKIVLFNLYQSGTNTTGVYHPFESFGDTPSDSTISQKINGTFYILLNNRSHFYPLFPNNVHSEEIYKNLDWNLLINK